MESAANNLFVLARKMMHNATAMSIFPNENGNNNGKDSGIYQRRKRPAEARLPAFEATESTVTFKNALGSKVRCTLLRISRHTAVVEIYNSSATPLLSEALDGFKIILQGRKVYSQRAIVSKIVDVGSKTICEVALDEAGWQHRDPRLLAKEEGPAIDEFNCFIHEWQKLYKLSSEFKLTVLDLQHFLYELRLWLDQIEAGIRSLPQEQQLEVESEISGKLRTSINPILSKLFERFEIASTKVSQDAVPEHRMFCHRQLHPLLLCCPFMYRIFAKPLGYAGDYEMIDMIIRNQFEGDSLFARLLQTYILDEDPAHSVRNRADYFIKRFIEEATRVSFQARPASFFSVGCGPAREVESFLTEHSLSDRTIFHLLDFDAKTLAHTGGILQRIKEQFGRKTPVHLVNKSVNQVLKESETVSSKGDGYDFIYCSGLYDYLSDRVCKQLNNFFYDQLRPGGLLVVTNFDPCNPIRNVMEYIFEWFLIYRDRKQLIELSPVRAARDDCRIISDETGCNIFLEVRKPL